MNKQNRIIDTENNQVVSRGENGWGGKKEMRQMIILIGIVVLNHCVV